VTEERFLVGLIGSGIRTSLTPPMHERAAARLGLKYMYLPIDVEGLDRPPDYLGGVVKYAHLLGFRGLNITHPFKQAVLEHLDEVAPLASAIGAVNTIVFVAGRAVGHNTDAPGFEQTFLRGLPGAALDKVVILGAGGAGSAVAHTLLGIGAKRIVVVDPLEVRLAQLAESLSRDYQRSRFSVSPPGDLEGNLREATGLVNATPIGMAAHPGIPLPPSLLRRELWVADIVYLPLETELLGAAREEGCRTLDGGGMAVFQAIASFELFTGRTPDTARMLEDFAELSGAAAMR
jgi:shikimate dehydrogenase